MYDCTLAAGFISRVRKLIDYKAAQLRCSSNPSTSVPTGVELVQCSHQHVTVRLSQPSRDMKSAAAVAAAAAGAGRLGPDKSRISHSIKRHSITCFSSSLQQGAVWPHPCSAAAVLGRVQQSAAVTEQQTSIAAAGGLLAGLTWRAVESHHRTPWKK
jgi:hypothetical protein